MINTHPPPRQVTYYVAAAMASCRAAEIHNFRRWMVKRVRAFTQEKWDALIAAYPPGTPVSGEVIHCAVFGVFVRLDSLPEVTALLEIIHFGLRVADPQHRIEFPADYPAVGSRIEARVLGWCRKSKDVRLTQLEHLEWIHSQWLAEQDAEPAAAPGRDGE